MKNAFALTLLALVVTAEPVLAQSAWVPAPGQGYAYVGGSRKTASTFFTKTGEVEAASPTGCCQNHDFRYFYLTGEVGIVPRLSGTFVVTYLYGLEGPDGHLEKNVGFSDAWFGLKYAVLDGATPVTAALTVRTPAFYDIPGPYSRNLYDDEGNFVGHSPEWRGVLKHDVTAQVLAGRSLGEGKGWVQGGAGFTWREGAPADAIPVHAEVGYGLPWLNASVKGTGQFVRSLGNWSERAPDDRFGTNPASAQNLNDQSMGRIGAAVLVPVGPKRRVNIELGYTRVVWGRSMRRYDEPYLSIGASF